MQQTQIEQIHQLLKTYRKKVIVFDTWNMIQQYLWIPAIMMLGIQVIGRIWAIENLPMITTLPLLVFILYTIGFTLFLPKSDLSIGWRVDQNIGLKERVSSGVAFAHREAPSDIEARALIEKQRQDALDSLQKTNPRTSFRLTYSRIHLIAAVFLIVSTGLLAYLPNPMDEILQTRHAIADAAEAQAEEIEDLKDEIAANDELSEEEKQALLRELEALAAQLRENNGDLAEALEDVSRLEQSLLERLDPNADFKQATLNSLAQQLTSLAQQSSATPEEINGLEEALDSLANELGEMSESERQAAAQNLQQMASQAAQAGNTSLAEALSALSQAAQSGSVEGAQQASEQVQQAMNESQSELSDQQSLESALSQLQESRQALSQSGNTGQTAQGQSGDQSGQSQNTGQGQGQGQGKNPSQGQGQGQGQGSSAGSGGGSNANSLPPSTGSGQAGSPQGSDPIGQAGTLDDQVFAPWERLQGENDPLSISGQDTGQGQSQVNEQDQPLPGTSTSSIVPYRDVFQSYQDTAYQTIEDSYIPPSLKSYILEYFSQLEP